jgi:hypothetical protein
MVTFFETPQRIKPAYSLINFGAFDSARSASDGLYYQFDITIDGTTVYIKMSPDINKQAVLNVSSILQQYFESNIINHSSLTFDSSQGLKSYTIKAHSIVGSEDYSLDSSTFYCFNGVDRYNQTYDISTYLFTKNSGHFLTNWNAEYNIHYGDNLYLQFFKGIFLDCSSNLTSITVSKHTGSTIDVSTFSLGLDNTPKLMSLNIGTSTLNINSSVNYYTIDASGLSLPLRININEVDSRFTPQRVYFIGSLGATESFNFDLIKTNNISIKRDTYKNNYLSKMYNTTVEDSYSISTNWISEAESQSLKELWYAPNIEIYNVNGNIPIILDESSKQIYYRKNIGLISYKLNYLLAKDYIIQKF